MLKGFSLFPKFSLTQHRLKIKIIFVFSCMSTPKSDTLIGVEIRKKNEGTVYPKGGYEK